MRDVPIANHDNGIRNDSAVGVEDPTAHRAAESGKDQAEFDCRAGVRAEGVLARRCIAFLSSGDVPAAVGVVDGEAAVRAARCQPMSGESVKLIARDEHIRAGDGEAGRVDHFALDADSFAQAQTRLGRFAGGDLDDRRSSPEGGPIEAGEVAAGW